MMPAVEVYPLPESGKSQVGRLDARRARGRRATFGGEKSESTCVAQHLPYPLHFPLHIPTPPPTAFFLRPGGFHEGFRAGDYRIWLGSTAHSFTLT